MSKKKYKIHIIGAGISGLIAAKVLEENGYSPTILEATNRPGGRIKTDIINGYQLDHGFQVLLTAYPAAQKHLNLKALNLQKFLPGAVIFKNSKQKIIGDPLRNISLLLPTLLSGIGTFYDKIKILQLNYRLKKKDLLTIFAEQEQTTGYYLKSLGFSNDIITHFFKPFFSGIFLETKLETSSRMFEFVYKMFGEGYAAIPKNGIEEIPKQISQNLTKTTIKLNTKVACVQKGKITLDNSEQLKSDFTIIATDPNTLIDGLKNKPFEWKSCETLYFETNTRVIKKPLIGLNTKRGSLINNIFYNTSLETSVSHNKQLLSVTVIDKQNLTNKVLLNKVKIELKEIFNIDSCKFIKQYSIPMALPKTKDIRYNTSHYQTTLPNNIFLAGDTLLNGSLNAAMISGENAANDVLQAISSTP